MAASDDVTRAQTATPTGAATPNPSATVHGTAACLDADEVDMVLRVARRNGSTCVVVEGKSAVYRALFATTLATAQPAVPVPQPSRAQWRQQQPPPPPTSQGGDASPPARGAGGAKKQSKRKRRSPASQRTSDARRERSDPRAAAPQSQRRETPTQFEARCREQASSVREPAGPASPAAREIDFGEYFDAEDSALADFSALDAARDAAASADASARHAGEGDEGMQDAADEQLPPLPPGLQPPAAGGAPPAAPAPEDATAPAEGDGGDLTALRHDERGTPLRHGRDRSPSPSPSHAEDEGAAPLPDAREEAGGAPPPGRSVGGPETETPATPELGRPRRVGGAPHVLP